MEKNYELTDKFREFLEKDQFIDCTINCGEENVKCHRIVLAYFSDYFKKLFTKETNGKAINECTIPNNYSPYIKFLISFLYTRTIEFTDENVIAFLAFSIKYDVPILRKIALEKTKERINKENFPIFTKQMVSFDICDDVEFIVPIIVSGYDLFNLNEIINSVGPKTLGKVLNNENFKTSSVNYKSLTDYKLSVLDAYNDLHPIQDEDCKEFLANLFDFTKDDSYLYVVNHKCKWAPSVVTLPLLRKVMQIRRESYRKFSKEVDDVKQDKISRWVPMQKCSEIDHTLKDPGDFDVIKFISTYAGKVKNFSPIALGTITTKFSKLLGVQPLSSKTASYTSFFGPHKAFMDDDWYFASIDSDPFIALSFGPEAVVNVKKITVFPIPEAVGKMKMKKIEGIIHCKDSEGTKLGYPKKLSIENENGLINGDVVFKDKAILVKNFKTNRLKISMCGLNRAGGNIFRIGRIQIDGCFVLQ